MSDWVSSDWVSRVGMELVRRTDSRRGTLGWLGRASTGLVAAGMALASSGTAQATGAGWAAGIRPAPAKPIFLPPGQQVLQPAACGFCSDRAEYVCSNCCAGDVCCSGSLYRQPCYDSSCNVYYVYWCA